VLRAIRSGASGYVLKGISGDALIEAVRSVYAGNSYISPSIAARVLSELSGRWGRAGPARDPISQLTAREESILKFVARGKTNVEIAEALDLKEATIKHYMTNILQKLYVRNRVEAALLARDRGL
jgi:two-component system nitrate/nitrite response regulator NarL